jgi:hypothetical protein
MGVQVDEAREHEEPRGVEHLRIAGAPLQAFADALDQPVAQQDVPAGIHPRGRVDQPPAAD